MSINLSDKKIPSLLPGGIRFFTRILLLLAHALERLVVRFTVQEPACIGIPFHPLVCFGVMGLTPFLHLAVSVPVAGLTILCHLSQNLVRQVISY